MATLSIPTPFRPYTGGTSTLEIEATSVGGAVQELVTQYPSLQQHLFTEEGKLRSFVNLFLNGEDVRYLQGEETELTTEDQLRIIPSIAGGKAIQKIDQTALKTNQAVIVLLSILAFLFNQPLLIGLVAFFMLLGTVIGKPGFGFIYKKALLPLGLAKPNVISDDPASHRFAQAVGTLFLGFALTSFGFGFAIAGWTFTWIVIALAFLNLVSGFCLGCAIYYWGIQLKHKREIAQQPAQGND